MGAILRHVTAVRTGTSNEIAVKGEVEAPTDGWVVTLEYDNQGIGGQFDQTLRLKLTAVKPEGIVPQVLSTVPFKGEAGEFEGNRDDETVFIALIGLTDPEGKDAIVVAID
ncbi:hypothetical protein [Nocardia salmonicida]|uniref:hypothetical protein n=1 Tax=Nocardia salmonicida TaxID=53431 RepID=UPI003CF12663